MTPRDAVHVTAVGVVLRCFRTATSWRHRVDDKSKKTERRVYLVDCKIRTVLLHSRYSRVKQSPYSCACATDRSSASTAAQRVASGAWTCGLAFWPTLCERGPSLVCFDSRWLNLARRWDAEVRTDGWKIETKSAQVPAYRRDSEVRVWLRSYCYMTVLL